MNKRDFENTLTVFKREFLAYFNSPVLYVIVVIFLLASQGFTFFFSRILDSDDVSLATRFFVWHPWIYTVLAPAVGMRLWSEEHRLGTIELLMTTYRRELPRLGYLTDGAEVRARARTCMHSPRTCATCTCPLSRV